MKKGALYFILILILISFVNGKMLTVKGKLVDQLTLKPIPGITLSSANVYSPTNVISDSDGNFIFNIDDSFILTDGSINNNKGASFYFYSQCYYGASIGLMKDYIVKNDEKYSLALTNYPFDSKEIIKDVSNQEIIDVGQILFYPMANLRVESDFPTSIDISYKYKNLMGYNGPGKSGYDYINYLPNSLPVDYDVFIRFKDENLNQYKSDVFHVPIDSKCKSINLDYYNQISDWSVENKQDIYGYQYDIQLKKGWNLIPFINLNNALSNESEITKNDIVVQYLYIPMINNYVRIFPMASDNDLTKEFEKYGVSSDTIRLFNKYFINMGTWINVKKSGKLIATTYDDYGKVVNHNYVSLYNGWNFKVIPKSMVGQKFDDIKGNCSIEKINIWDNDNQKWANINTLTTIDKSMINKVILIKARSICQFGNKDDSIGSNKNIKFPIEVGSYLLNKSEADNSCEQLKPNGESLGEYCAELTKLEYRDKYNINNVVSLGLIKILSGKETYLNYAKNEITPTTYDDKLYTEDGREIAWFTEGSYDIIISQEYEIIMSNNGESRKNKQTDSNNEVIQWFLTKYPRI